MTTTRNATNVDIVQSIYAAFARGDLDTVLAAMDPDIAWMTPATLPWSTGDYHGHAGATDYFSAFLTALTEPAIVPDEFLDAGDHIVVHGVERATAATTGRSFTARFTHTFTLRDGRVTRMRGVVDTAAIRDAFGPEDAAGSPTIGRG